MFMKKFYSRTAVVALAAYLFLWPSSAHAQSNYRFGQTLQQLQQEQQIDQLRREQEQDQLQQLNQLRQEQQLNQLREEEQLNQSQGWPVSDQFQRERREQQESIGR